MAEQTDNKRLMHIIEEIRMIEKFMVGIPKDDFIDNIPVQRQIYYEMAVIGEAASRISEATKKCYPEVQWRDAVDMRNVLIHEYFGVDAVKVWDTVQIDIPILKSQIEKILKEIS